MAMGYAGWIDDQIAAASSIKSDAAHLVMPHSKMAATEWKPRERSSGGAAMGPGPAALA
jgi:hypothetical protein